jgi:SAM-dependent MidA family methyltransferase
VIAEFVRERGPLTVAAFMDLALYHPDAGYYARAARRSGRAGDFFTSVDVGPLFGGLLAIQIEEMAAILGATPFSIVEAGAGNGRLMADIIAALSRRDPALAERLHVVLVEASAAARQQQAAALRPVWSRPFVSTASMPDPFDGVLVANELLDAFPVHQVVMREDGLRETYVRSATAGGATLSGSPRLETVEGPPSTPALAEYLDRLGIALEPGWRAEINLRAVEWMRDVARRLRRGFLIIADYGHEAAELYSVTHAGGTLTTYARHVAHGADAAAGPAWLEQPGNHDITAHVDLTTMRRTAAAEGLTTIGVLDQTYFVMGLLPYLGDAERVSRQLKTLMMPGGLGSTIKIMIFGKGVGVPPLRGCSYRMRVT